MDVDMDIDFDAGAPVAPPAQVTDTATADAPLPAAYYENLDARPVEQWPDFLNLQGVDGFDPQDAVYYLIQIGCQQRVKNQRWVNDSSVNLQFYSAEEAAQALHALTDPDHADPSALSPETGRKARRYDAKPDLNLIVRQANAGDQKIRNAGERSNYYRNNPDARAADRRGDRNRPGDREPRRRPPPRKDFLDYGDEEPAGGRRRSASGDARMRDDSDYDNRRNRRNGNRDGNRERDGRLGGRPADVDSYRPGSQSPRESRFGRLRGRSASPVSGDEGDGRYGFTEQGTSTRTRYRSRSRSRNERRRREPSGERWIHDRHNLSDREAARLAKDSSATRYGDAFASSSNHRRSDAFDESGGKGSLLSRMTKDGQPVAPKGRSLASRITRDTDDSSFGRLRDDDAPQYADFSEPAPKRGLADRITRDDDEFQIRGRGEQPEGINIRGTASQSGFSIRGVAGGV